MIIRHCPVCGTDYVLAEEKVFHLDSGAVVEEERLKRGESLQVTCTCGHTVTFPSGRVIIKSWFVAPANTEFECDLCFKRVGSIYYIEPITCSGKEVRYVCAACVWEQAYWSVK